MPPTCRTSMAVLASCGKPIPGAEPVSAPGPASDPAAAGPDATAAPDGAPSGRVDMIAATAIIIAVAVFAADSTRIRAFEAQMFPWLVLSALAALAAGLFVRGWRMDRGPEGARAPRVLIEPRAFGAFLGLTALYGVSVGYIGFFTASALYVPAMAWLI